MDADFLRRLFFYLVGISLGVLLVAVFFGDKAFRCSYFPNERVLDELRHKPKEFSPEFLIQLNQIGKDTIFIKDTLLYDADIHFGQSNVNQKPCGFYIMDCDSVQITLDKCDSLVVFKSAKQINPL